MIPIWISCYKYGNCVQVMLGGKSCLVEGLLGVTFGMGTSYCSIVKGDGTHGDFSFSILLGGYFTTSPLMAN